MTSALEIERERGALMLELFHRLKTWQLDPYSLTFELDIEEACEVLEPLLRAALRIREGTE